MAFTDKELSRAFFVTRTAFVFGAGSTMLINLAHADSGWGPKLASLIAPISILFVVEMLIHMPKANHRGITFLVRFSTFMIGAAAATISYVHTAELLISYGEKPLMAWILPIVPDGMMVVSSIILALVMREREKRTTRQLQEERAEKERLEHVAEAERLEAERERDHVRFMKEESARQEEAASPTQPIPDETEELVGTDMRSEDYLVESVDTDFTPPRRTGRRPATEVQEEARREYKKSTLSGYPLSAEDLAHKFGKQPRWGEERIAEVRHPQEV